MGTRAWAWVVASMVGLGCAGSWNTALDREAGTDVEPRWIGRPSETLEPDARWTVEQALADKGLLSEVPLPGELRQALIQFQGIEELAPTGWVDRDTVEALGLDPARILPIQAGAGATANPAYTEMTRQVGGEPGPASMPPTAVDVGAAVVAAPGDPVFLYEEARRLRAAAMELKGKASRLSEGAEVSLEEQADKALYVARVHATRFEDVGGESALAGVARDWAEEGALARAEGEGRIEGGSEATAGLEAGGEVRTGREADVSGADVERVQRILYTEGFLHRAPTGEIDAQTRDALRAFQTAQGWQPTGDLDRRTLDRLMGDRGADRPQGSAPPGSTLQGGPAPEEG